MPANASLANKLGIVSGGANAYSRSSVVPSEYANLLYTGKLPNTLSSSQAKMWTQQGLDLGELVQNGVMSYNPATDKFTLTQAGMELNASGTTTEDGGKIVRTQNINGQKLSVNESGQRLNEQGQVVWDPKTATTDVYGERFRQPGETRFVRNSQGNLKRQVLTKSGWETVKNRKQNRNRNRNQPSQPAAVSQTAFSVSNAFLNISAG
jgi:hypothetical protein